MLWDFMNTTMTAKTFQDFLESVYWDRTITVSGPKSAANLLLVHSDTEYLFSSNDLSWLSFSNCILVGKTAFEYDLFCIEVDCEPSEYYVVCAALVKLFNRAFTQRKLFLFRIDSSIAFGCKRDFDRDLPGNFCITKCFDMSLDSGILDFLTELPLITVEDLSWLVMEYSPQERNETARQQGGAGPDPDYLQFLKEFSSFYGVDTNREYEWYLSQFERQCLYKMTYQDAKELLSDIAEEKKMSSYEILDAAIEAEKKCIAVQINPEKTDVRPVLAEDSALGFSPEAFLKADVMLDEMLHRGEEDR